MALEYEQARRQAQAWVDASNRRDLDAVMALFHEEMTHQGPFADRRLGLENGTIEGKQAHREFMQWLWEHQQPPVRRVLEEVFTGTEGFAFVTRYDHDGTRLVFVWQVDADGLVRNQRVYHAPTPAP